MENYFFREREKYFYLEFFFLIFSNNFLIKNSSLLKKIFSKRTMHPNVLYKSHGNSSNLLDMIKILSQQRLIHSSENLLLACTLICSITTKRFLIIKPQDDFR